jgi:hypothetical protein
MYGNTWAYVLNSFDWTGAALPTGEIADNQALNAEPQPFWERCKAHYAQSWTSLFYYLKWRARIFVNKHRRVTLFSVVLSAAFLCYAFGIFKAMQEWSEQSRSSAKRKNQAITAAGQKKKDMLKAMKVAHMQRKKGRRGRAGKKPKFFQPSGGGEEEDYINVDSNDLPDDESSDDDGWDMYDQAQEEYYDYLSSHRNEKWDDQEFQRRFDEKTRDSRVRVRNQAKEAVPMMDDAKLRKAIYKSKHRRVACSTEELHSFISQAQAAYSKQMSEPLKTQAWSPSRLAAGVYKIFCGDRYLCTGTHVGNKLFVVVHSLSEDITLEYKAVNHVNTFKLFGKDIQLVNDEIAYFPISGFPSPFKTHNLHVMKDASIVTVFGFGDGRADQPDSVVGFASPLGWCNAPTRDGDCTSPVLDVNGNVVGFWTHGNGRDFGRFEPVTEAMQQIAKSNIGVNHAGLDFQLAPHSL